MTSAATTGAPRGPELQGRERVDWVDHAKGICIIFVVMMHSTLGVEAAAGGEGWMHAFVQFAKPFRMPDFFLISGLFFGLVIARPWRRYVDRKVLHFAYFYALWVTIQVAFKAPFWMAEGQSPAEIAGLYALSFVQPFGTLWFIYLLPVFFVVTRLLSGLPAWQLIAGAALLEILPVHTGWMVADEFAARYVYFLAGYLLSTNIFALAAWARRKPGTAISLIALWFAINGFATFTPIPVSLPVLSGSGFEIEYLSDLPVVSLILGGAGAIAIVTTTALLSLVPWFAFLGYIGRNSIVVYLAFFLPMVVTRIALFRLAPDLDIGSMSFLVTAMGVAGPLILHGIVRWTGWGRFLFERPAWASIDPAPGRNLRAGLHPAE